ncbi:E3 ubiquitin-protein ligase RNF128 isoform X1 [Amia ocellicauda]|uniref:E3 ubiquitin-protein ligase RNF128 isoform X1 n=1 Tax=Amia ocellicauda TaxID=2972642 RepID=UPI003464513B
MGRIGNYSVLLLWIIAWFTHTPARATVVWTAYVEISFTDPHGGYPLRYGCECGLYGLNSPLLDAEGQVEIPTRNPQACESDDFNRSTLPWIALIERGNCTFTEKISLAQQRGASAVVIYNIKGTGNETSPMIHHGTGDTVAIMIGNLKGMEIYELVRSGIQVTMRIEVGKQHGPWMSHYSVFFVSVSFFVVTAATVGYFIFYSARRLSAVRAVSRKQKQLKAEAKKAIGQLQVRTLKQGDKETGPDADSCAVCIDAYKPGDVLSILTCNHFFHKTCIEPWLLEHRTCPMCKCDILKALGVEPDVEEPSDPVPSTPAFRNFPSGVTEDDAHSETASSGYASVQGNEERMPAEEIPPFETECLNGETPEDGTMRVEVQPHYDNLGFEDESSNPRAAKS